MTDENYEARAQAHLASIKRDMKASMEDAVVRAMHKVMAEFEAKSDERLMEDRGPGPHEVHSLPARGPEQPAPVAEPRKQTPVATKLETQQFNCFHVSAEDFQKLKDLPVGTKLYTSPQPAQRKPLTDDEIESINVRLAGKRDLARLFARAIEAAHGITGETQ